jgi:glycosyltransferase involved in cell wall biosynthesis
MVDPRPAYASADVVIGMGGSVLRGMAFGKPCIVVGEQGYSEIFEPSTASSFFWRGYYGIGDGNISPIHLREQLQQLLEDAERRDVLGQFASDTIERRYSAAALASGLNDIYERTAASVPLAATRWLEGARLGLRLGAAAMLGVVRR